jgi:hypothetical protein
MLNIRKGRGGKAFTSFHKNYRKVKYFCELYKEKKFYFRQEFLQESGRWGEPRRISEETFLKIKSDGFPVEFRRIYKLPATIIRELQDIDDLIDLALALKNEQWFLELVAKRKSIIE